MRLMQWLFSPGRSKGADRLSGACRRWEREIYLSVSQDVPGSAFRALERHLRRCPPCRAEQRRVLLQQARFRSVALGRQAWRPIPELWAGTIRAASRRSDREPDGAALRVGWECGRSPGSRKAFATGLLAALAVIGASLILPVILERTGDHDSDRAALEARWARDWNEFVSGSGSHAPVPEDPFALTILTPEVVDF